LAVNTDSQWAGSCSGRADGRVAAIAVDTVKGFHIAVGVYY